MRNHLHALVLFALGVTAAMPRSLEGQADRLILLAIVNADSLELARMHFTSTSADGVTRAAQAFFSSAGDLSDRDLPELEIAPSGFVRIVTRPSADSVWVTPVRGGVRHSSQVIESGFQAPASAGRYEFFVSGRWAAHQDGSRPPSGPAITGTWALRLLVR